MSDAASSSSSGQLPEVEPALLAVFFSACGAETLLRLEAALGSRIGSDLRAHPAYGRNWAGVLEREAGLSVVQSSLAQLSLSASGCKNPFFAASPSTPLGGGWRGLSNKQELELCASVIHRLHVENLDGRLFADPDSPDLSSSCGESCGRVSRLSLAHFDVKECFGDSWSELVDAYHGGTQQLLRLQFIHTGRREQRRRSSAPVPCLVDGVCVPLTLTLSTIDEDPQLGIFIDICPEAFDPYFMAEDGLRSRRARRNDVLRVACILRCGGVERHSGFIVGACRDQQLPLLIDFKHLWCLSGCGSGLGHALWLEVFPNFDGEPFEIDEEVGTAQWNIGATRGSDVTELADLPGNELALEPICPGALAEKIAMIRRGGGIGFAQKAISAREAGAVGCIIYELEGDREELGYVWSMGQRFLGRDYPDPGIPCALIGAGPALRLLAALRVGGARARICIDTSQKAMRRVPTDFEKFRRCAARGEPVHCTVLVERAPRIQAAPQPTLAWFEGPSTKNPLRPRLAARTSPDSEVMIRIGTVRLAPADEEDDELEPGR